MLKLYTAHYIIVIIEAIASLWVAYIVWLTLSHRVRRVGKTRNHRIRVTVLTLFGKYVQQ